jgi:hypothetical protein
MKDPTDSPDDGSVARYYGDFSFESKNKVNEMIENIAQYPKNKKTLVPRTRQQRDPHTSGDAFFPSAS